MQANGTVPNLAGVLSNLATQPNLAEILSNLVNQQNSEVFYEFNVKTYIYLVQALLFN